MVTGTRSPRPATCGCRTLRTGATTTRTGAAAALGSAPGWASRRSTAIRRPTVSARGLSRSCGSVSHAGYSTTESTGSRPRRAATRSSVSRPVLVTASSGRPPGPPSRPARAASTNGRTGPGAVTSRVGRPAAANAAASAGSPATTSSSPAIPNAEPPVTAQGTSAGRYPGGLGAILPADGVARPGQRRRRRTLQRSVRRVGVKRVLGDREPLGEQRLDCTHRAVEMERQLPALDRGEVLEHEVGRILAPGRSTDAEPDPLVVPGAERLGHRPQPVMPVVAAVELEAHAAVRDVQLIVDHEQPLDRHLEEPADGDHRAAGVVHVALWLCQHGALAGQPALDDVRATAVRFEPAAHPPGEQVGDHEADVVPVAGVRRAGVAQADDEPADLAQTPAGWAGPPEPESAPTSPVPVAPSVTPSPTAACASS